MKRKMLISIALIIIMLLNCMLPLFVVNAAEGDEIKLNSSLYTAIKKSLTKQGIAYQGIDVTHTLVMTESARSAVKRLDLNEGSISDLTGLENFTGLTHLDLSGNNLSKTSNLKVLNSLTELTYLDLSTNRLDDVSEISSLINSLKEKGTIVLSSQTVTIVNTTSVNVEEESDNEEIAEFELPQILELAGYIKACWKKQLRVPQTESDIAPSVKDMPMYVSNTNKNVQIRVANEFGAPYRGLVKLEIYIYDDQTEADQANNPNKASENILTGSRFELYFVVHSSEETAITTMDTNLYKAIKAQLTAGQKINPELISYPYAVDINGETIYEEFSYTTQTISGIQYHILKNRETNVIEYALALNTNTLYEYDGSKFGKVIRTSVEQTTLHDVAEDGTITSKAGYKVAYVTDRIGVDLYEAAYDDARTFVINNNVLINKIKSLILNNQQIRDLSGIEKFIGLSSHLNVSHNYLSSIDPVYNLDTNKAEAETKLQEKYNYWLNTREYGNLSKASETMKKDKTDAEGKIEEIKSAGTRIVNVLKSAATLDPESENYGDEITSKVNSILEILKEVNGYIDAEGNEVKGSLQLLDEALEKTRKDIDNVYSYLSAVYNIYNREYRLTTLLTDELNYLTYDEYKAYYDATHTTTERAKALLTAEISKLTELETNGGLSQIDKKLLANAFYINFESEETKTPLADFFKEYMENTALNRVQILNMLETIRKVAIYSEMSNYCLIKRMNEDTATGQCYEVEYLENKIKEFGYDDIPADIEKEILEQIKGENIPTGLCKVYRDYQETGLAYVSTTGGSIGINPCKGSYQEVELLSKKAILYTTAELVSLATADVEEANVDAINSILSKIGLTTSANIIKEIEIHEDVEKELTRYTSPTKNLFLYDQMMSLATKLLKGNVARYVTLPRLKILDISYNAELDKLDGITQLTQLAEIYADYDYIADVTNIDWASMRNLKKLSLGYNYISDISNLTNMSNLKYLNLSNNLISGKLEITEEQYLNVFKNLKELDLSGNQITDITSLLIFLDHITGGNYANYLAREDTINISLKNQRIDLELPAPIYLSDYPTTVNVELPKIFTQLLAIDAARTAFGETSQNGRVESEGTYVTLNTRTPGAKEGKVVVLAMSGDGTPVETCVGEGTRATIKYVVSDSTSGRVTISPSENVKVKVGESKVFTALVEGADLEDKTVTWEVKDNSSTKTVITAEGKLTIGDNETSEYVTVVARSNGDPSAKDEVRVTVIKGDEPANPDDPTNKVTVSISPSENIEVKPGDTKDFTATVEGNVSDKTVTWQVSGNTSTNTQVSNIGRLTVGANETADNITVIATSNADKTVSKSVNVKIIKTTTPPDEDKTIKLTVSPAGNVEVKTGETKQFTATVEGNVADKTVTWALTGSKSTNTNISAEGLLTVAADETAESMKVTVMANANAELKKDVTITVKKTQNEPSKIDLGYETKDELVTGIKPKTPVSEFKKIMIKENADYEVVVKKDEQTINTGYMTTGMYVQIQDKNGETAKNENGDLLVYQTVVTGDVNRDGFANSIDSLLIKAHRNDVQGSKLVNDALEAADINTDKVVNSIDSKLLLYHRAEVKGYNLNYK